MPFLLVVPPAADPKVWSASLNRERERTDRVGPKSTVQ
jgi:hypothetical protein